jgi:hypothetical protein
VAQTSGVCRLRFCSGCEKAGRKKPMACSTATASARLELLPLVSVLTRRDQN